MRARLRTVPDDQRAARVATVVARLFLEYMDDRVDAWAGEDFFAVGRSAEGRFVHATRITKNGGVVHVQDTADFPGEDISDEEIASGLAAIADPRMIRVLRRLIVDRREGAAVNALAEQDEGVRGACDRLIDAGYLVRMRRSYGYTGPGMLLAATILALAAHPGVSGAEGGIQGVTTGI